MRSNHDLTPGAERVLAEASRWSGCDGIDELSAPSLLLGLLAESECRAALVLARHKIDAEAVFSRWPQLLRAGATARQIPFSADVQESFAAASALLHEFVRTLELATEHVLLGLAVADHETAQWLRQQGVDPAELEAEIRRQCGVSPDPLPMDGEPVDEGSLESGLHESSLETTPEPQRDTVVESPERCPPDVRPGEKISLLRVFDAAANRGREGLRVVEDYVRFVLDDRHLTELLKHLRHTLTSLVTQISIGDRLSARQTEADVGTDLSTPGERRRADAAGVLTANFTRLQESLRSLEEFSKLLAPELAAEFEGLRYRSYTLQRAVEITHAGRERLADRQLYVLIDGRPTPEEFEELAWSLVSAGVDVIQLRDKWLDDRRLYERARLLRQITRGGDTLFVMNDRPDIAAVVHADGVHVGQEELSVKDARTIVGPGPLVGVSTHSIQQARAAVIDGADYIGVGPVFASDTKRFNEFPGLSLLEEVAAEISLPAFAIGGITMQNVAEVLAAGFSRVALSGAITGSDDPAGAARRLLAVL